jgi:hypothetical protein
MRSDMRSWGGGVITLPEDMAWREANHAKNER